MICERCTTDFIGNKCSCGWQAKQLAVQDNWLIRDCATPGCFTAIRHKVGAAHSGICKWCISGESHAKMGHPAVDIRLRGKSKLTKVIP